MEKKINKKSLNLKIERSWQGNQRSIHPIKRNRYWVQRLIKILSKNWNLISKNIKKKIKSIVLKLLHHLKRLFTLTPKTVKERNKEENKGCIIISKRMAFTKSKIKLKATILKLILINSKISFMRKDRKMTDLN